MKNSATKKRRMFKVISYLTFGGKNISIFDDITKAGIYEQSLQNKIVPSNSRQIGGIIATELKYFYE